MCLDCRNVYIQGGVGFFFTVVYNLWCCLFLVESTDSSIVSSVSSISSTSTIEPAMAQKVVVSTGTAQVRAQPNTFVPLQEMLKQQSSSASVVTTPAVSIVQQVNRI